MACGVGPLLFGVAPGLLLSVLVAGLSGLSNANSRPAFLAVGSEPSTRYRGALLGRYRSPTRLARSSSVGGLAIGLGSYGSLALLTAYGGLAAAASALPLLRLSDS